jgi:allantoate deiminase
MERCDILGRLSEEPGMLTRPSLSPSMQQVNSLVAGWMREAGMSVQQDAIGNIFGRYEGQQAGMQTLVLGSHLDSVRNAGRYDGPLGVLVALSCVERLYRRGERLPFALEVVGFTDEEGLRFQHAYLGSKSATGMLAPDALLLTDATGTTLAEAIRGYGGIPEALKQPRWRREDLLGYCEVHIEQGPVLEAQQVPIGVVTAIAGQSRLNVRCIGLAGHAGTVPMSLRRDALCAAAECLLLIEKEACEYPGLVATVGQASVLPGASNVIPGEVRFSIDIRHQDDTTRARALSRVLEQIRASCQRRGITVQWEVLQESKAVHCQPRLRRLLERAVEASGYPLMTLPSGAGHDAVVMAELTDIAMLFVRCRGGISHHPDEAVAVEDVAIALDTLERFVLLLAQEAAV